MSELLTSHHTKGAHPVGQWLSGQRRTFRAGQMTGERAAELDALGIVWDTADSGSAENLAAAPAYYELHGTLAAPRHATALDKPVGQWLINVRPADSARTRYAPSGRRRRWPRSMRTGTPRCGGGRWTGSGTTPTSPSSSTRGRG
ncbi:hypothetical protein E6R62_35920 [Streptomyces sp. A1136]|nr:hypothetical protein E6R62_35920 [Streptomyces sp. A1136]